VARHPIALRIHEDTLEEIDRRARQARLSRTQYIIKRCLGESTDPNDTEIRIEDLERRIGRLEEERIASSW